MTPEEFAKKIRATAERIKKDNRPLQLAAASTHAQMSGRIFKEGLDSAETSIGNYQSAKGTFGKSDKGDMWRNPKDPHNRNKKGFSPLTGKGGYTGFKTSDNKRKTKYFKGWKGFRKAQGLKTNVVNLNYTGQLKSDFDNTALNSGKRPVPVRVNPNYYKVSFRHSQNSLIAKGNEKHFGTTIFRLSAPEKKTFFRVAEGELKLMLLR